MDLSVVRYLHKWVYSRNTNLFSVFNQFKPLSSLCFFHFFSSTFWVVCRNGELLYSSQAHTEEGKSGTNESKL